MQTKVQTQTKTFSIGEVKWLRIINLNCLVLIQVVYQLTIRGKFVKMGSKVANAQTFDL